MDFCVKDWQISNYDYCWDASPKDGKQIVPQIMAGSLYQHTSGYLFGS